MNRQFNYFKFTRNQHGLTLIELLVSVFVFAIGVLGYSALQTRSLQATYDNSQRQDVVWITESLIGRIRLNELAFSDYVGTLDGAYVCPGAAPANCAQAQGGGAVGACARTELSDYDVWDVLCNNPNGGLSAVKNLSIDLTCDSAACPIGSNLTLTSTWCSRSIESDDNVAEAAANDCVNTFAEQSYQVIFRP